MYYSFCLNWFGLIRSTRVKLTNDRCEFGHRIFNIFEITYTFLETTQIIVTIVIIQKYLESI